MFHIYVHPYMYFFNLILFFSLAIWLCSIPILNSYILQRFVFPKVSFLPNWKNKNFHFSFLTHFSCYVNFMWDTFFLLSLFWRVRFCSFQFTSKNLTPNQGYFIYNLIEGQYWLQLKKYFIFIFYIWIFKFGVSMLKLSF